jgi:hypothetical protein
MGKSKRDALLFPHGSNLSQQPLDRQSAGLSALDNGFENIGGEKLRRKSRRTWISFMFKRAAISGVSA